MKSVSFLVTHLRFVKARVTLMQVFPTPTSRPQIGRSSQVQPYKHRLKDTTKSPPASFRPFIICPDPDQSRVANSSPKPRIACCLPQGHNDHVVDHAFQAFSSTTPPQSRPSARRNVTHGHFFEKLSLARLEKLLEPSKVFPVFFPSASIGAVNKLPLLVDRQHPCLARTVLAGAKETATIPNSISNKTRSL